MALPFVFRGRRAERRAARHLRRRGLRILARNPRAGGGEIDLLAAEGGILVVVEVRRRRKGLLAADLSVNRAKEERLRRCLAALRKRHRIPASLPVRYDLVLLDGDGAITHLRNALQRPRDF